MDNNFPNLYKEKKPAVVAIASRISKNPHFPDVIGTGFIARSDGLIITNDHVVQEIKNLPKLKNSDSNDWPIVVIYLHWLKDKGMLIVPLEVDGVATLGREEPVEGNYYGPEIPDLGFIQVKAKGLPTLEIEDNFSLSEGEEVVYSGFPLGSKILRSPGWLHQISPTLQSGIVSSILPFPCDNPHAISIDSVVSHGFSGSPVFNPKNGKVVGIIYGGIEEPRPLIKLGDDMISYQMKTSIGYAIPSHVIKNVLDMVMKEDAMKEIDKSKFETIEELIERKEIKKSNPKEILKGIEFLNPEDVEH